MPIAETFFGYVETTHDSLILLEASRQGILPRVRRRLQEQERQLIKSGAVFCFNENESGIKRWTDGLVWSPSRILGNFLIYRELDDKKSGDNQIEDPQLITSGLTLLSKRQKERALFGSLRSTYRFKPNGLIKKSMSLMVNGVQLHLISYYNKDDILTNKFQTPSDIPELASIEISPELLRSQNFRIPFYLDDASNGDQVFEDNKKNKSTKSAISEKSSTSAKQKRRTSYMQLTSSRSTSRSSISSINSNNSNNPSMPTSLHQNSLLTTSSLSSSLSSHSLSPQEQAITYSQSPQSYDLNLFNSPSTPLPTTARHHHQQQKLNMAMHSPLSSPSPTATAQYTPQSNHLNYQQNSYSPNTYQFNENTYLPPPLSSSTSSSITTKHTSSTLKNINNNTNISSNNNENHQTNNNNNNNNNTEKNDFANLYKQSISFRDDLSNQDHVNSSIPQVSKQRHHQQQQQQKQSQSQSQSQSQPQTQNHHHHHHIPHTSVGVGSDYHFNHYVPHSFSSGYSNDRYEQNPHQHLFSSNSFHAINHASLHSRTELVSNAFSVDQASLLGLGWNDFEMQL